MTTKELIKTTIFTLLERYSADDLTVKMVCMECGISKQTLYNHYYCIMDAVEDEYKDSFERTDEECNAYHGWVECFHSTLKTLYARRTVSLHLYNSSHKSEFMSMIRKYGVILVKRGIDEWSRDIGIRIEERDRSFMLEFYMYVFMGIVENCFQNKMREDPEYIVSRCDAMMRSHIQQTLKNMFELEHGNF